MIANSTEQMFRKSCKMKRRVEYMDIELCTCGALK